MEFPTCQFEDDFNVRFYCWLSLFIGKLFSSAHAHEEVC